MNFRGQGRGGEYSGAFGGNRVNQQEINQFVAANAVPVEIAGWTGASADDCIKFISRKCRIVVSNYSVDPNTQILKGYVKNGKDADELTAWSGVKFAGQLLKITKATTAGSMTFATGGPRGNNNTIDTLTQFLRARYLPEMKILNLSYVSQDSNLVSKGFFASVSTTSKFFQALMKVAKELNLAVESVDLSGNGLSDLAAIVPLAYSFPSLRNLSLANNNIDKLKIFENWKNKLKYLRELIIAGNPLVNKVNLPEDIITIKAEIMKCFPRLIILNGEFVRNEEALLSKFSFPFKSEHMFFLDDETRNISTNFITNFYNMWDNNREGLGFLYQDISQFSMQLDSTHPHVVDSNTYNHSTDFSYYLPQSRNLTRVSSAKSRESRVASGPIEIVNAFLQLPKTRHDLINKPQLFSMESFPCPSPNGITITLHGSYDEAGPPSNQSHLNNSQPGNKNRNSMKYKKIPLGTKSFDRTFVVVPGPNDGLIVATDLLSIRSFGGNDAWSGYSVPSQEPPALPYSPQASTQAPTAAVSELPPEIKANLNDGQQELLVNILLATKLNLQYSVMLCEQSNWNYEQCIVNFKNSALSLPPDAFRP